MEAALPLSEEYCPNCGGWFDSLEYNYDVGWCNACSQQIDRRPKCSHCGVALQPHHQRSMCRTCRQEQWYTTHADELEFFMVVKGYSLYQARQHIARITRPVCQSCRKPIKGAAPSALFCKQNKQCRSHYGKFRRLLKQGLSRVEALDKVRLL